MKKIITLVLLSAVILPFWAHSQDTITEVTLKRIYISKHPQDPAYPQFMIHSKSSNFQMGFGGFVRITGAFDFRGVINDYDFITYQIPVGNVDMNKKHLYLDAHTSRLYTEILGKIKGEQIRLYIEVDFYSQHYYPRLRHAYGQIKGFLIGQTWTTFMDLDAMPNTIDFEGPNSAIALRTPMIRYSFDISKSFTVHAAAEQAITSMTYIAPLDATDQYIPDLILVFKFKRKFGHLQAGGVYRSMTYQDTLNNEYKNALGYGGTLSGLFNLSKNDKLMFQGVYGIGISNYIQDLAMAGLDAVPYEDVDRMDEMKSIESLGFYGAYQRFWTRKLNSSFIYGYINVFDELPDPELSYEYGQYFCFNLFWEPFPIIKVGAEYLWGQRRNYNGDQGNANRINALLQFTF